jgi:hypothetical protein
MEKGHVSISSGMKSASRPALLHADLVMRRLAFTARDLAWALCTFQAAFFLL